MSALIQQDEPQVRAVSTLPRNEIQTVDQVKAQVRRVQEVMEAVMKRETHYGVIPGTQKPTLYKAGSEVLLSTFRIAVEPEVDDMSTADEIRYRVRTVGRHQTTGIVVGVGLGECSSNEEKYKWRDAICEEEFELTDSDRRRIKFQRKRGGGHYQRKQIRADPSDVANTILKMAKKRSQIDMTLTALAASDIFAQDLEDLPEGMQEVGEDAGKPRTAPPQAAAPQGNGAKQATDKQIGLVRIKLDQAGIGENLFLERFSLKRLEDLQFAQVNDALAWIKETGA